MTDYDEQDNALIPSTEDEQEPLSMTLSGIGRGDALPGEGYESTGTTGGGGLLSHTTLIIAAVAVVAAGSLYLMRAAQGDLSNTKESQEIEAKIATTLERLNKPSLLPDSDPLLAENLSALLAPTDEVTAIFEHDVREQQVPIEEVKKDPFSLTLADNGLDTSAQDTGQQTNRRLAKLNEELDGLDLQSIMLGARNIAVIGGEFYKRGDRLGNFTITEIQKFTVYLESGGTPFELTLQNQGR